MRKKKYYIDERGSEGYIRLGNAVVKTAVNDYRKCLLVSKKHPFDERTQNELERIEKFFHSRLYGVITTLDPDTLIRKIREEY